MLSAEAYDAIRPRIEERLPKFEYQKVDMSLGQILEGDFFNQYIKSGKT